MLSGLLAVGVSWAVSVPEPKAGSPLLEAQAAYERKQYDQALALVDPLAQAATSPVEAKKLKVRTLIRLKRAADAWTEYERVEKQLGKDDPLLLREVGVGFILPLLTDMREQMRGAAYTALKEVESEDTVSYLEDGLSDGSGLVRALAVEGLGRLKSGGRSERFRKALEDQASIVRTSVLRVLGRSADRSVIPLLEHALKDDQATVRIVAAGGLVLLGKTEAMAVIRDGAKALNPEDRGAALRMLGELGKVEDRPVLEQALSDTQPSVRGAAAAALGEMGTPESIPAIAPLLKDIVPAVRAAAAVSISQMKSAEARPLLKSALSDPNPIVRAAAVDGLLRQGAPFDELSDVVRELTRSQDPTIRAAAAKALSHNPGPDVLGVLQALLQDDLPRPRIGAARALGHLRPSGAVIAILKGALRDTDDAVRATVGGALARSLRAKAPVTQSH